MQYLSKHVKMGFGSSSTKEKSSLLYNDLKRKLQYDSGALQATDMSAGIQKKDNLIGASTVSQLSAKVASRPGSNKNYGSGQLIAAKSLYLANQKSSATLNQRPGISRIKRRGNEEQEDLRASTANNGSVTTGSI